MKPINKPIKIKNAHLTSLWQTCKPVTLLIKHLQMGDLNKWVEKHYKWSLCMLQGMLNQECLIYMSPIKYLAAFPSHIHYLLLNTCRSKGLIGTNRQPRNKMQCFPHRLYSCSPPRYSNGCQVHIVTHFRILHFHIILCLSKRTTPSSIALLVVSLPSLGPSHLLSITHTLQRDSLLSRPSSKCTGCDVTYLMQA